MLYTIAYDGDIGFFPTYRTRERAERDAAHYRLFYPHHTYVVVEECSEQAEYARSTASIVD